MSNNSRARHVAEGRTGRIAKRAAIGVLGAPIALLAAAGPASAAAYDDAPDAADDDAATSYDFAPEASTLPGLDLASITGATPELPGLPALPGAATVTDL